MAKIVRITLGMLMRQEKTVVVEVPDDFDCESESETEQLMRDVYTQDDGDGFTTDYEWACEEGTHSWLGETNRHTKPDFRPDFRMDDEGVFEVTD
jgi:hypothetical protein